MEPTGPAAPPSSQQAGNWSAAAPGQAAAPGHAAAPAQAAARQAPEPVLPLRAGADRRLVGGVIAGGICYDIAARAGLATIATTVLVGVAAAALLLGGRVQGLTGRLVIGAAAVLALALTVSSSPWVTGPAASVIALLLLAGASLGADGSRLSLTFPDLGGRLWIATGHLAFGPGLLRPRVGLRNGSAARRAAAVGRGALLGVPVMVVVGLLLAGADPVFRSWFDLTAVVRHVVLALIGAWAVAGLARAATASRPSPARPAAPPLGIIEAACVLGGLSALYAAFVSAQFVALSDGGRHVLITHGLTYAQYARSGFFQLLACAAITLPVLLGVRACAVGHNRLLAGLSWLTVALTIGVVIIAIRRLQLYEAAYGLTMLRLASLVAAVWIGLVFALLAATIPRRGLPRRYLPAAVVVSGVLVIALWSASNPASIVASVNIGRAAAGQRFDVGQAARLGPDAVPALVAGLSRLVPAEAAALRRAICAAPAANARSTAFNIALARAAGARARACGSPR